MDPNKVDKIMQYALIVAVDNDFCHRELGRIHLIKYVYLADLEYAGRNKGETFTGTRWRFHKFGPWSVEVYKRVEPACLSVGAERKAIQSKHDDDFIRWHLTSDAFRNALENVLPITITSSVQWAVRRFGSDTYDLLNYVYLTKPMLNAAPGEFLDFSIVAEGSVVEHEEKVEKPTPKEKKRRDAELKEVKNKIQQKLSQKMEVSKKTLSIRPPRFDEVFFAGTDWLDSLSGPEIEEFKGQASFSPEIWKSRSRFESELP